MPKGPPPKRDPSDNRAADRVGNSLCSSPCLPSDRGALLHNRSGLSTCAASTRMLDLGKPARPSGEYLCRDARSEARQWCTR